MGDQKTGVSWVQGWQQSKAEQWGWERGGGVQTLASRQLATCLSAPVVVNSSAG